MVFSQKLNAQRICKPLAKALIRCAICAGWSEPLLVAHTTWLEISYCISYVVGTYLANSIPCRQDSQDTDNEIIFGEKGSLVSSQSFVCLLVHAI